MALQITSLLLRRRCRHLFVCSHYRPAQRTRYRITAPPGFRPVDLIAHEVITVTDTGCVVCVYRLCPVRLCQLMLLIYKW